MEIKALGISPRAPLDPHRFLFVRACIKTIVSSGKCPVNNIKETNKQAVIYVGKSLTLRFFCFMLTYYAWVS